MREAHDTFIVSPKKRPYAAESGQSLDACIFEPA